MSAAADTIALCRRHWQNLAPHVVERATAKCLIKAIITAEMLIRDNERLEMEARDLRLKVDNTPQ